MKHMAQKIGKLSSAGLNVSDYLQLEVGAFQSDEFLETTEKRTIRLHFASKSSVICISTPTPWEVNVQADRLEQFQREAYAAIVVSLNADETICEAELQAPAVSIVEGMSVLLVELPSLEHLTQVSTASKLDFGENVQYIVLDSGSWGRSFCCLCYYVSLNEATRERRRWLMLQVAK